MLIIPFFLFPTQGKNPLFPRGRFLQCDRTTLWTFFFIRVPLCFVDINTLYFRRTLYHIVTLYLYICAALRCKSWDTCINLLFYAVYKEFVTQLTELPPLPSLFFNHGVETVLQRLWPVYHNSELFNVHPHPSNSFLEAFQVWYARCISPSRDSFAEALEKGR